MGKIMPWLCSPSIHDVSRQMSRRLVVPASINSLDSSLGSGSRYRAQLWRYVTITQGTLVCALGEFHAQPKEAGSLQEPRKTGVAPATVDFFYGDLMRKSGLAPPQDDC